MELLIVCLKKWGLLLIIFFSIQKKENQESELLFFNT